ncbi:hypothetical protein [Pseudomonas sp. PB3P13]
MLPEADLRRLLQLQQPLADAQVKQDWARIGELNALITQSLQRLRDAGALTEKALVELAPLKKLHGQVLSSCTDECMRLKAILDRHTEFGEGRQAYSLVDSAQGER